MTTRGIPASAAPSAHPDRWPRITVVVPSRDQGSFLEAALRSVLDQHYPNLELIVADGGSRDQSLAILDRYAEHFTWWCSEPDRGQAHAINKGFRRATGEILGWLNSDDLLLPGSLLRIGHAFSRTRARGAAAPDAVAGLRREVHENGTLGSHWFRDLPSPQHLRRYCCLAQETVYFHRRVYEQLGGLDESMDFALDYEYWLRMITHGYRFTMLPAYLGGCRDHPHTKRATAAHARARDLRRLLRRYRLAQNEEEALMRAGSDWSVRMAMLEDLSHSRLARHPRLALASMRLLDLPFWAQKAASLYRGYRSRRPRQSTGGRLRALAGAVARELAGRPQPDAFDLRLLPSSPIQRPSATASQIARPAAFAAQPADTLALGAGWSWLERASDCVYRWGRSGAEIIVFQPSGARRRLRLDLQSGPSLDWQPFDLTVRDEAQRVIAEHHVDQQGTVILALPLAPGPGQRRFRLHTDTRNKTANALDARVLDFRATFVGWQTSTPQVDLPQFAAETVELMPATAEAGDIVPIAALTQRQRAPRDGLFLGAGWSAITQGPNGPWRSIQHAADLIVTRASGRPRKLTVVAELDPAWRSDTESPRDTILARGTILLRLTAVADSAASPRSHSQPFHGSSSLLFPIHLPRNRHVRLRLRPHLARSRHGHPVEAGPVTVPCGALRVRSIRWS